MLILAERHVLDQSEPLLPMMRWPFSKFCTGSAAVCELLDIICRFTCMVWLLFAESRTVGFRGDSVVMMLTESVRGLST